jgi:predicted MFS family arabinose efflux permease
MIPLLLELGLAQTWIGLGVVSLVLTAASWFAWPASMPRRVEQRGAVHVPQAVRFGFRVKLLYVQYGLLAAAAVPTMVFLVDFIARGLQRGMHVGSVFWAIYGLGAIAGPPLYGYLADRMGPQVTIRLVSAMMALVLLGFYAVSDLAVLGALTAMIGTFAPGMVPLVLARVHEVVPHDAVRQNLAWTRASVTSAAALAVAAYGFSALFNATGGDHRVLFLVAAAVLLAVLLVDIAATSKFISSSVRRWGASSK